MDPKEILKQVVNDKINDNDTDANEGIHAYLVAKLQSMAGLSQQQVFDNDYDDDL